MALRFWHQWLRNLPAPKQTISRPAARQRPRLRPCLEALEDRTLLSLDFNSALNLDTYAWVKLHTGDPLLPLDPIPKTIGDLQDTIKYNWNQGRSPDAVAIGDFNGDGNPDIAVADFNAGNQGKISILLGSGDGSFAHTQPVVDLTTNPQRIGLLDSGGIAPVALVAARLRGPNAPLDLIVANRGIDGLFANVSVLLGNGDGNFQAPKPFEAGLAPTALAVGDFNGDGNLDVVVADRTFLPGTATVLFGDGNGGFSSSVSLGLDTASSFSFYPESVAVGDFYGDGHLDFVTANSGSNNVTVVRGNGDGTFRSAVSYGTDTAPVSVAVADMNGDGRLDIITANNGGDDVSILFQNPDGSYPINSPLIFPAGLTPTAVVVGNFDGAGPGLAVTNGQDSAASGNAVAILRFNPSHNPDNSDLLLPPTFYRTGQHPVSVAAAHLRPGMPGVV